MNWLREHGFALRASLARLRSAPGSFAFNVLVIALALILPLAGLTLRNGRSEAEGGAGVVVIGQSVVAAALDVQAGEIEPARSRRAEKEVAENK